MSISSSEGGESESDIDAYYGPADLPGTGRGKITSDQRAIINAETGCNAAIRKVDGWPKRQLTIFGPSKQLKIARLIAKCFILEFQNNDNGGPDAEIDTPGAEDDPCSVKEMALESKNERKRLARNRKRDNRKRREREERKEEATASLRRQQQLQPTLEHPMVSMMRFFTAGMPSMQYPPGLPIPPPPPPTDACVKKEPIVKVEPMTVKKEPIKVEPMKIEIKKEANVVPAATIKSEPIKVEGGLAGLKAKATPLNRPRAEPFPSKTPPWKQKWRATSSAEGDDILEPVPPDPIKITVFDSDEEDIAFEEGV